MPVSITITADDTLDLRGQMLKLLGPNTSPVLLSNEPQLAPQYTGGAAELPASVTHANVTTVPLSDVGETPKRTRRTKAQIEADEAAAKAAAEPTPLEAAISATPEDRVNPEDEAAEEADGIEDMADGPAPGAPLTTDDLRTVAGLIVRKFDNDVARAQAACVGVFKANGVESISKCPDDKIAVVHAALTAIANGSAS